LTAAWRSLRLLLHELVGSGGAFNPTPTSSRSAALVWLAPVDGGLAEHPRSPLVETRARRWPPWCVTLGAPQLPTHGAHRRRRPPAACSPHPPPPRIPLQRPCGMLSREWLCVWWLSPLGGERTSSRVPILWPGGVGR
jgi:hypothetical protein